MYILAFILCLLWLFFILRVALSGGLGRYTGFFLGLGSLVAVWISEPDLWHALANSYATDSFWDLGLFGGFGVVLISSTLIGFAYWLSARKSRYLVRKVPANPFLAAIVTLGDMVVSVLLFGVLHNLSPQAFYTFYQFIIPDLPNQLVIKGLFDAEKFIRLMSFDTSDSLSNHLSGIAMIGLVPLTAMVHALEQKWKFSISIAHQFLITAAVSIILHCTTRLL